MEKPNIFPAMPVSFPVDKAAIQNELDIAMEQIYFVIVKIDLVCDRVIILYSKDYPETVSHEFSWTDYLSWYLSPGA